MLQAPAPKSPAQLSRVFVIVALVVIAAIAGAYYLETLGSTTSVLASTEIGDLQLNVNTNSSVLSPGHSLGITVSLSNVASQPLNISAQANWTVPGFPVAVTGACFGPEPVEFMVVRGNFSLSDLSKESVNSTGFPVFCMEGGDVNYFLFEPDSSVANLTGYFCTANCHPDSSVSNLTSSFAVGGYWAYPINSSEANDVLTPAHPSCEINGEPGGCVTFNYPEAGPIPQHPFVAGVYTLVVCDEWNQTVILHFSI